MKTIDIERLKDNLLTLAEIGKVRREESPGWRTLKNITEE